MKALLLILIVGLGGSLALPGAMRFDGVDDRAVHYPASTNLNLTNEITISIWLVKEAGMANSAEFVCKGRNENGNKANYHLRDDGSGGFEFYYASPDATFHGIKSGGALAATNVPIHLLITHQFGTTNGTMFWTNGIRASVRPSFGTPQSTGGITNNSSLTFMGYSGGQYTRGLLMESAVWGATLTPDEIAALSRSRTRGTPLLIRRSALRGYWPLDRPFPYFTTASGSNAVLDLSGYGQHLTPLNSPQARPGHLHAR